MIEYLTTNDVSEYLWRAYRIKRSPTTLTTQRSRGSKSPIPFHKISRQVLYARVDLDAWAKEMLGQTHLSTHSRAPTRSTTGHPPLSRPPVSPTKDGAAGTGLGSSSADNVEKVVQTFDEAGRVLFAPTGGFDLRAATDPEDARR